MASRPLNGAAVPAAPEAVSVVSAPASVQTIAPEPAIATASMLRVPSVAVVPAETRIAPSSTFGPVKPASAARVSLFGWLPLPRFLQRHA